MNDPENFIGYVWESGLVWIYGSIILIVLVYTVIKLRRQVRKAKGIGKKSSGDLLKRQYERGEISKEEYEIKKNELG